MAMSKVNPSMMVAVAQDLDSKNEEWAMAVKRIYQLQAEMDGMWDGNANDNFNRIFNEEMKLYQGLYQMMGEYSGAIKTAAQSYVQGEEEVRNIMSRQ